MTADELAARQLREGAEIAWERRWAWPDDMNGDGVQTVADTWEWVKAVFFAPGDFLLLNFMRTKATTAHFWELSPAMLGGGFSAILSLLVWGLAAGLVIGWLDRLRDWSFRRAR